VYWGFQLDIVVIDLGEFTHGEDAFDITKFMRFRERPLSDEKTWPPRFDLLKSNNVAKSTG
jgi:hypothetical protein